MHPSIQQPEFATCPLCGMDLVPVTRDEVETGTVFVDEQRRQLIGVRTEAAETRPLTQRIRAVGRVGYDESRLADVTLRVDGWIGELFADETGRPVREGETLFTLYSPELFTAQEELLTALASRREARAAGAPDRAGYLVEAARRKLRLWSLTDAQIDGIAAEGASREYVHILSPVSGYVVEKNVVAGASVRAGARLYRIAALDRVWIEADLPEAQLAAVHERQRAEISFPSAPGSPVSARVTFVHPYLDGAARTGRARLELENPGLALRPDMYANVDFAVELGPRLTVPESAVIYAGPRRAVFLDLGEGRYRPQVIETGVRAGDRVEVLSGLAEGDRVVASGNFLLAAESRLKVAMETWR